MAAVLHLSTADELCRELGVRLREQRLAQSLTQDALALRAGISLGALKKIERDGQANMRTLMRVVQALGLTSELETLFRLRARASIAEMERMESAKRRRAPRSPA